MIEDHVAALKRSRAKLVEQRRTLVKRDCSTDRAEGYAERIIAIQASLDATDRAILDEEMLAQRGLDTVLSQTAMPQTVMPQTIAPPESNRQRN